MHSSQTKSEVLMVLTTTQSEKTASQSMSAQATLLGSTTESSIASPLQTAL